MKMLISITLILLATLLLPPLANTAAVTHTCTITSVQRLSAWRYTIEGHCLTARLTFRTNVYRAFHVGDVVSVTGTINTRELTVQRIRLHRTPQR